MKKLEIVDDSLLAVIGRHNKQLEDLNLFDCDKVSDIGIVTLTESLPGLKVLNLSSCNNISNAGLTKALRNLTCSFTSD